MHMELASRQTGKTARLIEAVHRQYDKYVSGTGKKPAIVTMNDGTSSWIKEKLLSCCNIPVTHVVKDIPAAEFCKPFYDEFMFIHNMTADNIVSDGYYSSTIPDEMTEEQQVMITKLLTFTETT